MVFITDNYFDRCGSTASGGVTVSIYNVKRVRIIGNTFYDCGIGSSGSSWAVFFNPNTSSDFISLDQNIFLSPTGQTLVAVYRAPTHTFTNPANNRFTNNILNGLDAPAANTFLYFSTDNICGLTTGIPVAISVTIAHGLSFTPRWANVQPQSSNIAGIKNITADATNITVTFTALPTGTTVNLFWSVQA